LRRFREGPAAGASSASEGTSGCNTNLNLAKVPRRSRRRRIFGQQRHHRYENNVKPSQG
jgi:hypothetical protein